MEIRGRSLMRDVPGSERASGLRRHLMWLAFALQLLHVATLIILRHPLVTSNCIQVLLPIVAVLGCIACRTVSLEEHSRRTWVVLCAAFVIWTVAEIAYLLELYLLPQGSPYSRIDDVLWLFFAVPILLALSGCLEGALSRISFLDQAQATTSFLVVAILVFSRQGSLSFNDAYSIQEPRTASLLHCSLLYGRVTTG